MHSKNPDFPIDSAIIESFSKYARSYEKYAQIQISMAERLASMLPEKFPDKALELGCGTGIFTKHLLAHSPQNLIVNDISPAMIEHLISNIILPENHKIVSGNAEITPFEKVNLITANAVFQWFQNPVITLGKMKELLKPQGQLIFSVFGPQTLVEFRNISGIGSPATLRGRNEWKVIMQTSGFRKIQSDVEIRKTFAPSCRNLLKVLQQIGAAPIRMFSGSKLRKVIRDYDKNYSTSQGVYATWELYYFSASF